MLSLDCGQRLGLSDRADNCMSDANTFVSTLWRNGILGDALGTLASVVLLFAKVLAERGQYPSGEQCRNPRNWGNCL